MNLREFVNESLKGAKGFKPITSYAEVVREERYFCALLYHCMLQDSDGMQEFLKKCGVGPENQQEPKVYVEYAMVRDLWRQLNRRGTRTVERNKWKRAFIVDMLLRDLSDSDRTKYRELLMDDESLSVLDFNKIFVAGNASTRFIQSPSRWGIGAICRSKDRLGTALIQSACMLKWAFNAKPDIVIELGNDTVVCIEAKVESKEGLYASSDSDKSAIRDALGKVEADDWLKMNASQVAVQNHIMKDILGFGTIHEVFLDNKLVDGSLKNHMNWECAFGCFACSSNSIVEQALKRLKEIGG